MSTTSNRLHWTQRFALIRGSLHSASRSGDFTFFKSLQAAATLEGSNHVAVLSAEMGDDVDLLLAAMDNLNAGLAYVHQDVFQKVYEGLKYSMKEEGDGDATIESMNSRLYVDITMQRNIADRAIDKLTNSALALINYQSETFQELAANVWITRATIIADCIEIGLKEMLALDTKMNDFGPGDNKDPFDMDLDEVPPVPDMPTLPEFTAVPNESMREKQGLMGMV